MKRTEEVELSCKNVKTAVAPLHVSPNRARRVLYQDMSSMNYPVRNNSSRPKDTSKGHIPFVSQQHHLWSSTIFIELSPISFHPYAISFLPVTCRFADHHNFKLHMKLVGFKLETRQ